MNAALKQDCDLLVIDGGSNADTSTLEIAKESQLIIIPTGVTADDLQPQVLFALELRQRGIAPEKIIFVLNKTTESAIATADARRYINQAGYEVANIDIPWRTGFQMAQNLGKAISESVFPSLNQRAENLAQELVSKATTVVGEYA